MKQNNSLFIYVILGLLAALAPVINNMYSPAMPSMVDFFGVSESMVQGGLMMGMLGLAVGQLVFGPLSDRVGRRRPLLVSIVLFIISTVCILPVTDASVFVALRFVQGFAAAGGIVNSRSVASDMFTDRDLLKAFAVINIVNGVAPIVTPILGGTAVSLAGWQGVFVIMLVIGVILAAGCFMLQESLPENKRSNRSFLATFNLFGIVLRNRRFVSMLLHQAAALALLFGNIAASAFIAQHYGVNSQLHGITLAINGIFIGIGAGMAAKLPTALRGVRVSSIGMVAASVIVGATLCLELGFIAYEVAVCVMLCFMGITLTSSTSVALESAREHAGTASALFGAAGFLVGGMISPIVSLGNMLYSTSAVFLAGAVLAAAFAMLYPRSSQHISQ